MIKKLFLIAGTAVLAGAANAGWYTNEADFVSALSGSYYKETFDNFTYGDPLDGSMTDWSAPGGNGYGWSANAPQGLWSNDGALSTNVAYDPLTFTFTGNPVTAFGGLLAASDISGNVISGTLTLTLSDGSSQTVNTSGSFLGWTGSAAITSVTMTVADPGDGVFRWNQIDNVYTGASTVPEPASMIALGLGAAAMLRRRRAAKK